MYLSCSQHTKDMKCTNFQVSSMSSASSPSTSGTKPKQINLNTNDVNPSIKMDLQGISATCTGEYDAGFGMSGNIVASVSSSDGPLHLQVDIASAPLADFKNSIKGNSAKFIHKDGGHDAKENPQNKTTLLFPSKSTVSSCLSNLLVHDVKFTGSASAKIIDLFSGTISERVTTALNGATCPLIQSKIETLLNDALHSAGMYVRSLILNSTPDYYESMAGSNSMDVNSYLEEKIVLGNKNSGAIFGGKSLPQILGKDNSVRWDHEMKFLKRVLLGLNNFVFDHLNEGIVLKILHKLSTWQMTTTADCEDCG